MIMASVGLTSTLGEASLLSAFSASSNRPCRCSHHGLNLDVSELEATFTQGDQGRGGAHLSGANGNPIKMTSGQNHCAANGALYAQWVSSL